jgi:hypothetical protein
MDPIFTGQTVQKKRRIFGKNLYSLFGVGLHLGHQYQMLLHAIYHVTYLWRDLCLLPPLAKVTPDTRAHSGKRLSRNSLKEVIL